MTTDHRAATGTESQTARLRELIGRLRLPAVAAPMTGVSNPALVIAACRAGIAGAFPTGNAASPAQLDEWFDEIAAVLDGRSGAGPVVANLIMGRTNRRLDDDLACVLRHRPPLVITSVGSPAPVIAPLHEAGCLVLADVASMAHAEKALAAGADGLVLLAAGAGGHTGWANPFAFVRAVRARSDVPLAVAGGMSDGSALWGAVCAGYDLGLFGTRFIATHESGAAARWKGALIDASLDDVVVATAPNGVPASLLRTEPGSAPVGSAGHTVSSVREITSVAALVASLVAERDAARAATLAALRT